MKTQQELEKRARELEKLQSEAKAEYQEALKLNRRAAKTARQALVNLTRWNIQLMRVNGALAIADEEDPPSHGGPLSAEVQDHGEPSNPEAKRITARPEDA